MTYDDMIYKLYKELHTNSALCEGQLFVPLNEMMYYLQLSYGIGYDHGKKYNSQIREVESYNISNGETIKVFPSTKYAADLFKVSKKSIQRAIAEQTKVKGYNWRYKH